MDSARIIVKDAVHDVASNAFTIVFAVTHGKTTKNFTYTGDLSCIPNDSQAMLDLAWDHTRPSVDCWLRSLILVPIIGMEYVPPINLTAYKKIELYRAFVKELVNMSAGGPPHQELARAIEDSSVDLNSVHAMLAGVAFTSYNKK